jgi:hypothetical protein
MNGIAHARTEPAGHAARPTRSQEAISGVVIALENAYAALRQRWPELPAVVITVFYDRHRSVRGYFWDGQWRSPSWRHNPLRSPTRAARLCWDRSPDSALPLGAPASRLFTCRCAYASRAVGAVWLAQHLGGGWRLLGLCRFGRAPNCSRPAVSPSTCYWCA